MLVHGIGHRGSIRIAHNKISPPTTRKEKQDYIENELTENGEKVVALLKSARYVFDIRHLAEVRKSIRFTKITWKTETLNQSKWDLDRDKERFLTFEQIYYHFDADIPKNSRKIGLA